MVEPQLEIIHQGFVAVLEGAVHLGVVDGQRALITDGAHELELLIGESIRVVGVKAQDPHTLAAE